MRKVGGLAGEVGAGPMDGVLPNVCPLESLNGWNDDEMSVLGGPICRGVCWQFQGVISGAFFFPANLPRSHRMDFDVFHCSSRYTLVPPANSSGIPCPARTKNAILLQ